MLALRDADPADLLLGDAVAMHVGAGAQTDVLHRVAEAIRHFELPGAGDPAGRRVDLRRRDGRDRVHDLADEHGLALAFVQGLRGDASRQDAQAAFALPMDFTHADAFRDLGGRRRRPVVHLGVDTVDLRRVEAGVGGRHETGFDRELSLRLGGSACHRCVATTDERDALARLRH